ncbi:MAG: hypothetical protein KAI35_07240 [Desulfobulbaceae bacterium]|nr:hypothetical protein [Desulfobulbaceae bacterium]
MIQDYAHRYTLVMGEMQRVSSRDETGFGRSGLLWKVSGVMVVVLMVIGMVFSYWIGWQIRSGLGELAQSQTIYQKFSGLKNEMEVRRGNLLALENFEVTAGEFGLYRPTDRQVRYP